MSIQTIIKSLEKLVTLHLSLLEISKQKTVVIKEGSVEKLQQLLTKEHRHVQAVEQLEGKRQNEVKEWCSNQRIPGENATITTILEHISDAEIGSELAQVTTALTKAITDLKQQEQLNQALIQQSMKFIELSLDMLNPTLKNMNYGNNNDTGSVKRSVFDSKA